MQALIHRRRLTIKRYGRDRYGRTLAMVHAGRVNLACAQIAAGQAQYLPKWDIGTKVGRACRIRP